MDRRSHLPELRRARAIAARIPTGTTITMPLFAGLVIAIMLFTLPAFAQTAAQPMPENASAKSYSDGWEGLHGFRSADKDACVAVEAPEGGFLAPSRGGWHCLRGNMKVDDTRQKVVLPAKAHLADASYGSARTCKRGFEATGDLCTTVVVPANAYLTGSGFGQPWTCERGFFEQAGRCHVVPILEPGYFHDAAYGPGCKCGRRYAASAQTCEFISSPENAHLDRSGNR